MANGLTALAYGQQQPQQSGWRNFLSGLKEFFVGHPEMLYQIQQFSPEQLNILNQLLGQGSSIVQNPYAEFGPIEQYAKSQFSQNIVPSLAERFTSMGQNSMSSPAFASQLSQAGAGLAENLAAMRSQYGMQNRAQGLSMLGMGLQPHYANLQQGAQGGLLQNIFPTMGKIATQAGLGYMGAPANAGLAGVKSALNKLL